MSGFRTTEGDQISTYRIARKPDDVIRLESRVIVDDAGRAVIELDRTTATALGRRLSILAK